MIYEETSGPSPKELYDQGVYMELPASWGMSWSTFWLNSWGFTGLESPYNVSNNAVGNPFETNNTTSDTIYEQTAGTNPDPIYEEN